jgi:hypothetical protein
MLATALTDRRLKGHGGGLQNLGAIRVCSWETDLEDAPPE